MTHTMRQRRYLVTDFDRSVLPIAPGQAFGAHNVERVRQGYFDISPTEQLMVRLYEGTRTARMIRKSGHGVERTFDERNYLYEDGVWIHAACPYDLTKSRHWMGEYARFDVFEDALTGVFTLELHGAGADAPLPSWIKEAREVTHSITNLHLAKLNRALKDSGETFNAVRHLKRIRRIVLTGGPGSGKSTLMEELRVAYGSLLHCVPEVATIVFGQVGIRPAGDSVGARGIQRTMTDVQKLFESVSSDQAVRDGKTVLLLDRGTLDNAAYVPGGLPAFERMVGTIRQSEWSEYDLVICLDAPSREVYEKIKANNPARRETYEQAVELAEATAFAWAGHPNLHFIHDRGGVTWNQKRDQVFGLIDRFLNP